MDIKQNLILSSKYLIKAPYEMSPIGICVHNTANDASAKNEISYMINNDNKTSYHIAIDDIEAIQSIPFNRNAWHAGDGGSGLGNRKYIGIEICYSKSGGERFIKAEENAVDVIVQILKQFNWGIDRVKKHQDFSKKYCPHRTLDMGWDRFLNMIQSKLNGINIAEEIKPIISSPPIAKMSYIEEFQITARNLNYKDVNGNLLNLDGSYGKLSQSVANKYQISKGSNDAFVGLVQKILKVKGFYNGNIDNSFGNQTDKAVREFQKSQGLKADGYVGASTMGKLLK